MCRLKRMWGRKGVEEVWLQVGRGGVTEVELEEVLEQLPSCV